MVRGFLIVPLYTHPGPTASAALAFPGEIQYNEKKGGSKMGTEAERQDTRKAMAYDLNRIYKQVFDEETCKKIEEIQDQYLENDSHWDTKECL